MRCGTLSLVIGLLFLQDWAYGGQQPTRRQFLGSSAALTAPMFLPGAAVAANNERLTMRFYVFRGHLIKAENVAYAAEPIMSTYASFGGWQGPGPIPADHFIVEFESSAEMDLFWNALSSILRNSQFVRGAQATVARSELGTEVVAAETFGARAQARLLGLIRGGSVNTNAFVAFANWLQEGDETAENGSSTPLCDEQLMELIPLGGSTQF